MSEKLTPKQKIDELLGITDGSSIDDFLNDLSLDTEEISETFKNIDEKVKENIEKIDSNIQAVQNNSNSINIKNEAFLNIQTIDDSLKEIEDLISISKQIFKHVYTSIISTDLVDSELISSAAKLLESIHINISEFLTVYKEKQRFADKMKLMIFQQEQRKEMLELKHKYDLEKLKIKAEINEALEVENLASYSQEQIIKLIN